ncbi:MAG: formamidopyrimidine-DNA glycosylase [Labilithrix sp.]|nr:formamidopyrimidine-DNA glycosylase [Labilithrix sp.]
MPELPDVDVYIEHIAARTLGHTLERVRLASPFVLRTAEPPLAAAAGRRVVSASRLGKRIVLGLGDEAGPAALYLVIHLMVAGRFKWKPAGAPVPGKLGLAAFDFDSGTLLLTEASTKKRASVHLVRADGLAALDPGGVEVLGSDVGAFAARLRSENHTLKRALTDPRLFSGIGNAYSDEILHHARMSPVKLTSRLTDEEIARLHASIHVVLEEWTDRLRKEAGEFPEKVTAFRPEMAVHGKYGEPCPRCARPVQRIRYADNESNYCPTCQTDGKLLADRSLSRLMRGDWPKTLEELEAKKTQGRAASAPAGSFAARAASFIPERAAPADADAKTSAPATPAPAGPNAKDYARRGGAIATATNAPKKKSAVTATDASAPAPGRATSPAAPGRATSPAPGKKGSATAPGKTGSAVAPGKTGSATRGHSRRR